VRTEISVLIGPVDPFVSFVEVLVVLSGRFRLLPSNVGPPGLPGDGGSSGGSLLVTLKELPVTPLLSDS
jgi:hypothetical protein